MEFEKKTSTKVKYPIGAYAPGYYMSKCYQCDEEFTGDKYARMCEPCAINQLNAWALELRDENVKLKKTLENLKQIRDVLNNIEYEDN
jgi:hypothetical protein